MPKIPDMMLNNIFYLYETVEDAKEGKRFGGTGFVVMVPSQVSPEGGYIYGVTNWHVACRDACSVVRMNRHDGQTDIFNYEPHEWVFDPRYDIAVRHLPSDLDTHKMSFIDSGSFLTEKIREKCRIGLGDDVFMLGRFVDHDGGQTNRPTARFGNISLMPSPIAQPNGVTANSYCVDLHSRSGYSGSPVFVYRTLGNDLELMVSGKRKEKNGPLGPATFLGLLGIHWGQFPEFWRVESGHAVVDEAVASGPLIREGEYVKGVSGMTCVLPAAYIVEVLNMPSIKVPRDRAELKLAERLRQTGAVPPDAESAISPDENPEHRTDFNRLVGAAAKKRPPSD